MLAWGYKGDIACVFCQNGTESRNHLFFGCGFCSRLWRTCMKRCNIPNSPNDWEDILEEGCRSWRTKAIREVLCQLVLSATVYEIWKACNAIWHGGQIKTKEQILKFIIWEVRYRVSGKRNFKKNLENISLCLNWNIDVNACFGLIKLLDDRWVYRGFLCFVCSLIVLSVFVQYYSFC